MSKVKKTRKNFISGRNKLRQYDNADKQELLPSDELEEELITEDTAEVPLENTEEEDAVILEEEGSLDGDAEEVEELSAESESEDETEEVVDEVAEEEPAAVEETVEEVVEEEPAAVEETVEEVVEEEPAAVEETVEEVVEEEPAAVEETVEEVVEEEPAAVEETTEEVVSVEKTAGEEPLKQAKEEFKLTPPDNLEEILSNICAKRARKLIYRPSEEIFSLTTEVLGTDKNNEEKINVKKILEAEIKQGVKLGYLDKFDGLKGSELKEEYENDIVYEFAEQEFKRTGLVLDGNKVKVYVFDWDMKACHHIGYISDESAELVKPYLIDREKYSFDVNGIIVGGKYKKITKDATTGKVTVEKGNDGKLGVELDITVINRKD